ncbi:AsnC family transcriptional regulator, partial [Sulfolobus sp. B5]
ASELAKRLNVSRSTATKLITRLREKGVKFTIEFMSESFIGFVISEECNGECYKLLDGRYMNLVRANTLDELQIKLSQIKGKEITFLARNDFTLKCDYCGKEIHDSPITFRMGRRVYYACCSSCLEGIKKKFARRIVSK